MALTITHTTTATLPDEAGVEINKDEWNASHTIAGSLTAADVGAPSGSGTSTGANTGDNVEVTAQTVGFTITKGTTPKTLTVALDASVSGSNTGDQSLTALVVGPASVTDAHVALFDGTTGKLIKDGGAPATGTVTAVSVATSSGFSGSSSGGPTPALTIALATQSAGDSTTNGATTAFVTTAVANAVAGVNPAVAVSAATTVAGDTSGLTYANGVAGVGATLTGSLNTAVTIDGVAFTTVGQRLLVKNDTQSPSGAFNGVYRMSVLQTVGIAPVFMRATDYNQPSDINNTGSIPVVSGTANGTTSWLLTSAITTVGTDALTYVQFSVAPASVVTLTGSQALTNKTYNGNTWTAGTGTLTLGAGSTLVTSATYSITLTATGATNVTVPTTGTLAILGANTFTAAQRITEANLGSISNATITFDWTAAGVQYYTATGSTVTWAFSNTPTSGTFGEMLINATNQGAYTFAAGTTVNWELPTSPVTYTTTWATYLAANLPRVALASSGVDQFFLWVTKGVVYGKLV